VGGDNAHRGRVPHHSGRNVGGAAPLLLGTSATRRAQLDALPSNRNLAIWQRARHHGVGPALGPDGQELAV